MDVEQKVISKLEDLVSDTGCARAAISKGDKKLSWDGTIEVFSPEESRYRKNALTYDIPVQVKGHKLTKYDKEPNRFDVEIADLKNYRGKGGTLFFKGCVDETSGEVTVYYKALLPGNIDTILDNARGEKTARVQLDPFPTEIPMVEAVLVRFAEAMFDESKSKAEKRWTDYEPKAPLTLLAPEPEEPPRSPYLYDAGTVGFHGRGGELAQLRAFLDDERRFCWWGVVGEGGVGKSRLAYELCNQLNDTGDWYAQRLDRNDLDELPELTREEFNERFPYRTLLVVDYAQQHAAALGAWMRRLAARDFGRREKLRVLLLERADKDANGEAPWEKELLGGRRADALHHARYAELMELGAPPPADLRDIMLDFAAYLRTKETKLPSLGADEADALLGQLARMPEVKGRPLFAMLLADAALHRKRRTDWSWESLLQYQLDREHDLLVSRLGEGAAGNELLQNAVLMLRRVATVLGVSGDIARETMDELCPDELAEVREAAREAHVSEETLLRRLGLLDASLERICALRPDLFGEYLVLDFLRAAREEERDRLFAAILTDEDATKTFFLRLLRDFGELIQTPKGFVNWLFPEAVPDDERAAALVRILRTLFEGAPIEAAATDPNGGSTYVFANSEASRASLVRRMKTYVDALREDGVPAAHALGNYASVLHDIGDYSAAAEYYLRSLRIKEDKLPPDSPDTATTYNNLALAYKYMGDFPKALNFYEKTLNIYEKVLGKEHPDTATTYNNLALTYKYMGDFPKALEFYEKALAIVEKVLGKEHPDTAATYNNLAGVYQDMGDFPKALEFFEKALAIVEKVLGKEHPNTATTCNNIAGVYQDMGNYPKALEFFEKDRAISEKVLGKEHPDTATTYNNLALTYKYMGDYPKALEFYEKALTIREKVLGKEHPDTAATYNNIAGVYQDMGNYPKALEFYEKALAIVEKVLGKEHPNTATTCNNIGVLYLYWHKPNEAVPWLRRALAIWEAVLGAAHPNTQTARDSLEIAERLAGVEQAPRSGKLARLFKRFRHTPPTP